MASRILILVFCAGAALLLAVLTNHFWWSPTVPVVLGFLCIFVPSLLLLVAMEPTARLPYPDEKLWLYTGLVGGLFGLAIPAAWLQAEVRRFALESLPQPSSIARVLERDPPIVLTSCALLLSNDLNLSASDAAAMLTPETATLCMANTAPSEHREAVVAHLLTRWDQALAAGEDSCVHAAAVDALPLAEPNRVGVLLSCALGADADSRACCAARLGERSPEALLAQTREAMPILQQLGRTDELLALAFGESQLVAQLAPTPTALDLRTPAHQVLTLTTSCAAIAADVERVDDRRYLEWVFGEFDGCFEEPPDDVIDAVAVCDALTADGALPLSGDLGDAICQARRSVALEKIAAAAEFRRGLTFAEDASSIDLGHDAQEEARLSASSLGAMFQAGEAPTSEADQARMKQMMMGQMPASLRDVPEEQQGQSREQSQRAVKDSMQPIDMSNVQKALGVSLEELEAATENGELTEEMQKRVNQRAKE